MKEEQDDLTLVYMFGFKNGRNSTKDEIKRLRAALKPLVEAVEHARDNSAFIEHQKAHRVTVSVWQLLCKQVKTARAALEGEKTDV